MAGWGGAHLLLRHQRIGRCTCATLVGGICFAGPACLCLPACLPACVGWGGADGEVVAYVEVKASSSWEKGYFEVCARARARARSWAWGHVRMHVIAPTQQSVGYALVNAARIDVI